MSYHSILEYIESLAKIYFNTSKIEKPNLKKKFSAKKQQNTLPLTENKVKENTSLKEVKRDKKLLKKISNKKNSTWLLFFLCTKAALLLFSGSCVTRLIIL